MNPIHGEAILQNLESSKRLAALDCFDNEGEANKCVPAPSDGTYSMTQLGAVQGNFRDYLFTNEGVYRVEMLPTTKRIVAEWWPFTFLVLVLQAFLFGSFITNGLVLAFGAGVLVNTYLSGVLGKRARQALHSDLSSAEVWQAVLAPVPRPL